MSETEIIYGTNPVLETLRAGRRRCHEVFVALGRREADALRIVKEAEGARVAVKTIQKEELAKLCGTDKHQGVCARVGCYPYAALEEIIGAALKDKFKGFVLILDGITDPQNFGSLVRTSHLMGVHGVIIAKDKAAFVTSVVVKASAGATEYQRIAQVTNIVSAIEELKAKEFWVAGADGESPDIVYMHDFKGYNNAVVLGAEGRGLRRLVKERCDYLISIPMQGAIDSYNVAVAGALFMSEVARSRWFSMQAKSVPNAAK